MTSSGITHKSPEVKVEKLDHGHGTIYAISPSSYDLCWDGNTDVGLRVFDSVACAVATLH